MKYNFIDSPELATVRRASQISTLVIASSNIISFNLIFLFYSSDRTNLQFGVVFVSYAFLIFAMIFNKQNFSSALALISMTTTSITLTFYGPTLDIKAVGSTTIFLSVLLGITTLPKKWIPTWIIINVIHLAFLVTNLGIPTLFFGIELPVRTFSIVQLVVVSIWFYRAWFPQLEFVKARDILNKRLSESRDSAIELQERTRKWRELLVHTHETVLNDIRSVLDSKNLDYKELKKQLSSRQKMIKSPASANLNFSDLMAEAQEYLSIQVDLNISGAGTEIPHNVYSALRSVIVEVGRNFERHANATKIVSKASLVYGILRIELFHNGKDSTSSFESGIGQAIVVKETLDEINGKLFRRISGVELSIELKMRQPSNRNLGATDVGRIVVSAVSVGNAIGGIFFPLSLTLHSNFYEKLAGLSVIFLSVFAAVVNWKKVPLNRKYIIASLFVSVVQTITTNIALSTTQSIDLLAIISVLTGFALVSIIAWADSLRWWMAIVPWFIGIIAFRMQIDPETSGSAISSLNTGYGIPFFAGAIVFGLIRGNRRLIESEDLSQLEIRERAAATAVADLAEELDTAIGEATKTLIAVSKEENISVANRNALRKFDSLIRAIIQVDPKTSSGFSQGALEIVRHAASAGVQIKVLTIRDQGTFATLREDVLEELKRIIENSKDAKSSIQVLANSESSILVLKISSSTAKRANIDGLSNLSSDELILKIEDSNDEKIIFVEQVSAS